MSDLIRLIDERIRIAMRGTERIRGVVASTVVSGVCSVKVGESIQPAIVPALPIALEIGMVVELERPRGTGGQLHVVSVLGVSNATPSQGTWEPSLTFTTPGDLAVVYTARDGRWYRQGSLVFVQGTFVTTTFTHTTSAGSVRHTTLPFKARELTAGWRLSGTMGGWTKASFTQVVPCVLSGTDYVTWAALGSGQDAAIMTATDFPSAGTVAVAFSGWYEAA